jgi:uncharacterized membrane protein YphA (DoxX/SURF4 family)
MALCRRARAADKSATTVLLHFLASGLFRAGVGVFAGHGIAKEQEQRINPLLRFCWQGVARIEKRF